MNKSVLTAGAVLLAIAGVPPLAIAATAAAPPGSTAGPANAGQSDSFKLTQDEVRRMQDQIRRVQQALSERGYRPGRTDGIIGPRTTRALRAFQRQQGMAATGRIDHRTTAALDVPGLHSGTDDTQPSTTGSK